jgi:hypothetical protein
MPEKLPTYAISVRQPWAWALIHGGKDVENRNKAPIGTANLIGHRVAIHASRGMTRREYESARDFMLNLGVDCPRPDDLIRGAIIGSVRVDQIVSERPSRWFFGPRGIVVDRPESCAPIACKGQLGWFIWKPFDGPLTQPLPWMRAWPGAQTAKAPVETVDEPDLFK